MIVEDLIEYIELNKLYCKKSRDESLIGGERWKMFDTRIRTYSEILDRIKDFING